MDAYPVDSTTARAGFQGNWNWPDGIDGSIGAVGGDGKGVLDKATRITVYARGRNSTGAVTDGPERHVGAFTVMAAVPLPAGALLLGVAGRRRRDAA